MDLKLRAIPLILQFEIIFGLWTGKETPQAERFRIYLDEDESLIIPKRHSEVKLLSPLIYSDKFYVPLPSKTNKKLLYAKHAPVIFSKLKHGLDLTDGEKKCCGNKWTLDSKEVSLEQLIRPVSLPSYRPTHIHEYQNFEDVKHQNFEDIKPVREHIEDDLKYDFRTKTHSFR